MCRGWLLNEVGCLTVGDLDMGWWFCGGSVADMFGSGSRRNMNTSFNADGFVTDVLLPGTMLKQLRNY